MNKILDIESISEMIKEYNIRFFETEEILLENYPFIRIAPDVNQNTF